MIRYKNYVIEDYFIDEETAVITDINGKVKNQVLHHGRAEVCIHGISMPVHCIQAHTAWGYNPELIVHHDDWNPLNNALKNLKYITPEIHNTIHHKGKQVSQESIEKAKQTRSERIIIPYERTEEQREAISIAITERNKKCSWFNNGIEEKFCEVCPDGFTEGRLLGVNQGHPISDEQKAIISNAITERNKKCRWWVNALGETKFQEEKPSDEWQQGRKYKENI